MKKTEKKVSQKTVKKRGNIATLKPFKKGESGNPNGRPKLTAIEKSAREAERKEIAEVWPRIKVLSFAQIKELMADKEKPVIELAMASAIYHAIKNGNMSEVHRFYDRLLGKPLVTNDVTVSGDSDNPLSISIIPIKVQDEFSDPG